MGTRKRARTPGLYPGGLSSLEVKPSKGKRAGRARRSRPVRARRGDVTPEASPAIGAERRHEPRAERWSRAEPALQPRPGVSSAEPVPWRPPPSWGSAEVKGRAPGTPRLAPSSGCRRSEPRARPVIAVPRRGPGRAGSARSSLFPRVGVREQGRGGAARGTGAPRASGPSPPVRAGRFLCGPPRGREPSPHFRANSDTCSLSRHMSRWGRPPGRG